MSSEPPPDPVADILILRPSTPFELPQVALLVDHLKLNVTLKVINLSGNFLGDAKVSFLSQFLLYNNTVHTLDLSSNSVGPSGCATLMTALLNNKGLTSLNLSSNYLGTEGMRSVAQCIQVNTTLKSLNLGKNHVDHKGLLFLSQGLKLNTTLELVELSEHALTQDELAKLPLIEFQHSFPLVSKIVSGVVVMNDGLSVGQQLQFNNAHYTDDPNASAYSSSLFCFGYFQYNSIQNGNGVIPRFPNLVELDLRHNRVSSLAPFLDLKCLVKFLVSHNEVQQMPVANELDKWQYLTVLDISYNHIRSLPSFQHMPNLVTVNAEHNQLRKLNVEADVGHPALKELLVSGNALQAPFDKLVRLNSNLLLLLRKYLLHLPNPRLPISGATYDLTGAFKLPEQEIETISSKLNGNDLYGLHSLCLSWNHLQPADVKLLVEGLLNNTTLTSLDLAANAIGDEGCRWLGLLFANNRFITQLDLCCPPSPLSTRLRLTLPPATTVGPTGALYLCGGLKSNLVMKKLDISCNSIGPEGAQHLADCLKDNRSLTHLIAREIQVGVPGIKLIADSLHLNSTLQRIDLEGNEIVSDSMRAFSSCLAVNKSLLELNLSSNLVDIYGVMQLRSGLLANTTLQQLCLLDNEIGHIPPGFPELELILHALQQGKLRIRTNALVQSLLHYRAENSGVADSTPMKWTSPLTYIASFQGNQLVQCPLVVQSFHNLLKLDVCSNQLSSLDPLLPLRLLLQLDASNNEIAALPVNMASWDLLSVLTLRANKLRAIDAVVQLPSLVSLNVEQNQIVTVPLALASSQLRLEQLLIAGNPPLQSPLSKIARTQPNVMPMLRSLRKKSNHRETFIPWLSSLNLSVNKLNLNQHLIQLDLFKFMCDTLKDNMQITELDLGWNRLDKTAMELLAECLRSNRRITHLALEANDIGTEGSKTLLSCLKINRTLRKIDLKDNDITLFGLLYARKTLTKVMATTALLSIDMRDNLFTLPVDEVPHLSKDLLVQDRIRATKASKPLEKLTNFVNRNLVDSVQLNGRTQLCHGYFKQNQLVTCQNIVEAFKFLVSLDVSRNQIARLDKLLALQFLTELDASHNQITHLPLSLAQWKYMISLDLSYNKIESMGEVLALKNLQSLKIEQNSLKTLPLELVSLPLKELWVSGNPFGPVFSHFTTSGPNVFEYLKQLKEGSTPWSQAKVVLCGREGVGKSHLIHRLQKNQAQYFNSSTNGVEVKVIDNLRGSRNNNVTLCFYDFGGQEVFYPTHQFFLSGKAIFLIVFKTAERLDKASKIDYWLKTIRAVSRTAKIHLVGTHLDEMPEPRDPKVQAQWAAEIKDKYHLLRLNAEITFVSSTQQTNIPKLSRSIIQLAESLAALSEPIPNSYHVCPSSGTFDFPYLTTLLQDAADLIVSSRNRVPFVEFKDFKARFAPSLTDEGAQTLASFLNDAGVITWFDNPDLRSLVVLDSAWLAYVMSSIISVHQKWKNAIVSRSDLEICWHDTTKIPIEFRDTIISLLDKFDILFPFKSPMLTTQAWIVPCMLPASVTPEFVKAAAPFAKWTPEKGYHRIFRTMDFKFVPKGFFSKVVVRLMHLLFVDCLASWLNGLVLCQQAERPLKTSHIQPVATIAASAALPAQPARQSQPEMKRIGDPEKLLLEFNEDTCVLTITALIPDNRLDYTEDLFSTVTSSIHDVADTYRVQAVESAVCCHCIDKGKFAEGQIQVDALQQAFVNGNTYIPCPVDPTQQVPMVRIAPDVCLARIRNFTPRQIKPLNVELGAGGFGTVTLGEWDNQLVAVKELKPSDQKTKQDVFLDWHHEVYLMSKLSHPNLVKLHGIMLNPMKFVMEYCDAGDLHAVLLADPLSWDVKLRILRDIASGVAFLHLQRPPIVHRDLRTPNVFLSKIPKPDGPPEYSAKIGDFGLSIQFATKLTETLGNWDWLAPEVFDSDSKYDEQSDSYSFGMIAWNCAHPSLLPFAENEKYVQFEKVRMAKSDVERNPGHVAELKKRGIKIELLPDGSIEYTNEYFKIQEIKRAIVEEDLRPLILAKDIPPFLLDLIRACWDKNPKARPTFAKIVEILDLHLRSTQDPTAPVTPPPTSPAPQVSPRAQPKSPSPLARLPNELMARYRSQSLSVVPPSVVAIISSNASPPASPTGAPRARALPHTPSIFNPSTNIAGSSPPVHSGSTEVLIPSEKPGSAEAAALSSTPNPFDKWLFDTERLSLADKIKSGTLGPVYKAVLKNSDGETQVVAQRLSALRVPPASEDKFKSDILRLLDITPHPNLVVYLGVTFEAPGAVLLVSEFAPYGPLNSYFGRQMLDQAQKLSVMAQVASGLLHLHANGIVHGSVSAKNVLFDTQNYPKLAGAGIRRLAKVFEKPGSAVSLPVKPNAPEASSSNLTLQTDVFAFATFCWEVLTEAEPFEELDFMQALFAIRSQGLRLVPPPDTPPFLASLLARCWDTQPSARPSMHEIVETFAQNLG